MPHPIFKHIRSADRHRERTVERLNSTRLRIAQMTDLHIPGERALSRRLRDLVRQYESAQRLSFEMSAIYNELSHPYRNDRAGYNRLIRKALIGLRRLDVDHLIVTGDIGHCGIPSEFAEFKAALRSAGWLTSEQLTVVPGNHDRFNLYEGYYDNEIDDFFDVVRPGKPRFREPIEGLGIFEIDSNREPSQRLPDSEKWLPNATGSVRQREIDELEAKLDQFTGEYFILALHHHLSQDWYIDRTTNYGGLMAPLSEGEKIIDVLSPDARDFDIRVLHGHRHVVMPIEYTYRSVPISSPGAFFDHFRINLFDIEPNRIDSATQIRLQKG